jgi:hypothetical protein
VDFVQYHETFLTRWNHGSVRFNSNIPFPGAPPPLEMGEFSKTNGLCQFLLTGPADTLCITEISADLVNWAPLATNNISPVRLVSIADSNSLAEERRFLTTLARRCDQSDQLFRECRNRVSNRSGWI